MLKLNDSNYRKLETGKAGTIRKGIKHISVGEHAIVNVDKNVATMCFVHSVKVVKYKELTLCDAKADGFDTLEELQNELRYIYGYLRATQPVTVIRFRLLP